jgi:hypothetical protein
MSVQVIKGVPEYFMDGLQFVRHSSVVRQFASTPEDLVTAANEIAGIRQTLREDVDTNATCWVEVNGRALTNREHCSLLRLFCSTDEQITAAAVAILVRADREVCALQID